MVDSLTYELTSVFYNTCCIQLIEKLGFIFVVLRPQNSVSEIDGD
jgi:hypothetical protein